MASKSSIEWTDASYTPIRARNRETGKVGWHCVHESEGCRFCYAEGMNKRLGTGLEYKPQNESKIELFLDEEMLLAPLRWKKPRMIFVCSMADLFADFVKDEWIDKIFAVMALCPQHTFQVLTKRAERMREYLTLQGRSRLYGHIEFIADQSGVPVSRYVHPDDSFKFEQPLPNVWLGVSCERQEEADERIPLLLQTPAAVRFISAEPLLGSIDLFRYIDPLVVIPPLLDWVIVGGESGPGAREHDLQWSRDLITQCKAAGVAVFEKQLGSAPFSAKDRITYRGCKRADRPSGFSRYLNDRKGGDWSEWPQDLRVREFPSPQGQRESTSGESQSTQEGLVQS